MVLTSDLRNCRLSTVRHSDLIVVVRSGAIVEKGSHDELLSIGGTYAELARQQGLL
jgi:ABC-type multidrug transport system fused ATPase/permease subunit